MGNPLHYIIRMCAYVYARKYRRILTDGKHLVRPRKKHPEAFKKNASAFDLKRKGVSLQTQGRFSSNASAFWMERKGVFFYEQKQKEILHGNGHKKRSSAELQPLLTLNLIL